MNEKRVEVSRTELKSCLDQSGSITLVDRWEGGTTDEGRELLPSFLLPLLSISCLLLSIGEHHTTGFTTVRGFFLSKFKSLKDFTNILRPSSS